MCVIIIARTVFPSMTVLKQAEESNPDGAGMCWFEEDKVKWAKGLKADDIFEIGQDTPKPWVIHFRWASFGPKVPQLCHPFPINRDASLELQGETDRSVFFHNGHVKNIEQRMYEALGRTNMTCPPGPWSDSRGMAFVIDKFGVPMLNFQPSNQKFAVMSVAKREEKLVPLIYRYGEWEQQDGLELSSPLIREKKFDLDIVLGEQGLLGWSKTHTKTIDIDSTSSPVPYWRQNKLEEGGKWSKTIQ